MIMWSATIILLYDEKRNHSEYRWKYETKIKFYWIMSNLLSTNVARISVLMFRVDYTYTIHYSCMHTYNKLT